MSRQPTEADLRHAREALAIAIETAQSPDLVVRANKKWPDIKEQYEGCPPIKFSPLSTQTKSIVNGENGSRLRLREIFLDETWRKEKLRQQIWSRRIFS
ncbi:hypothetical protein TomTYG45_37850 [Sphingobium sp. TomTYG45]